MPDDCCTTSVLRFCPLNTTHRGGISLGSTSVPLQFWRRYLLLLVPALELNLNRRICHVLISRMNPARRSLARVEITHLELARSPGFQCAPLVRSGVRMSFFFLRSSGYKNSTMCNITGVRPGRRQTLTGYKPRAANSSLGLSSRVLLSRSFITQAIIRRLAVTTLCSCHLLPFQKKMRVACITALLVSQLGSTVVANLLAVPQWCLATRKLHYIVEPKVVIISMFEPEGDVWYGIPEFNVLEKVGFNCTPLANALIVTSIIQ